MVIKSGVCFLILFVLVEAIFLAGVYGKGHTFFENLLPNSLPVHTRVLENTTLFSDPICKGYLPLWERCDNSEWVKWSESEREKSIGHDSYDTSTSKNRVSPTNGRNI